MLIMRTVIGVLSFHLHCASNFFLSQFDIFFQYIFSMYEHYIVYYMYGHC